MRASGTPVVASDGGGIPKMIIPYETGLLIEKHTRLYKWNNLKGMK